MFAGPGPIRLRLTNEILHRSNSCRLLRIFFISVCLAITQRNTMSMESTSIVTRSCSGNEKLPLESWSLKIERHLSEVRNVWAFVSNHFEGFAPETCQRIAGRLGLDLRLPSETRKPSQLETVATRSSIIARGAPATVGDTARSSRLCFSKTHTSRIPKLDIFSA